jgi:hypothetical protein
MREARAEEGSQVSLETPEARDARGRHQASQRGLEPGDLNHLAGIESTFEGHELREFQRLYWAARQSAGIRGAAALALAEMRRLAAARFGVPTWRET